MTELGTAAFSVSGAGDINPRQKLETTQDGQTPKVIIYTVET
jgi:hypothetical protein